MNCGRRRAKSWPSGRTLLAPAGRSSRLLGDAPGCTILGMTKAAKDVLADALRLDLADRAELAGELIASLDGPSDPDAAEAWDAEIRRRAASLEDGTATVESWDDVKRRIGKHVLGR